MPLIVDEAHGSHLGLHPGFPPSAMQQGADVAVQSTHKTLTSLGQSSMLHCQGPLIQRQRLAQSLRMLQVALQPFHPPDVGPLWGRMLGTVRVRERSSDRPKKSFPRDLDDTPPGPFPSIVTPGLLLLKITV